MMSLGMVKAAIIFKLLSASLLDMCKLFEHIDMLSIGIWQQPYSVIPTHLGGDLGHLWSQNDVIRSWLRLPSYLIASHIPIRHIESV
jgi:hypothetical protein